MTIKLKLIQKLNHAYISVTVTLQFSTHASFSASTVNNTHEHIILTIIIYYQAIQSNGKLPKMQRKINCFYSSKPLRTNILKEHRNNFFLNKRHPVKHDFYYSFEKNIHICKSQSLKQEVIDSAICKKRTSWQCVSSLGLPPTSTVC